METAGQQIYMRNGGADAENMTISFSLVQHGIGATINATADTDQSDGLSIGGGSASVTVAQAHNVDSGDPMLAADLDKQQYKKHTTKQAIISKKLLPP